MMGRRFGFLEVLPAEDCQEPGKAVRQEPCILYPGVFESILGFDDLMESCRACVAADIGLSCNLIQTEDGLTR